MEKLGFLVTEEKCSVTPCQCIVFLGAQLDSTTMTLSSLSKAKQQFGLMSTSLCSGEWLNEDSVHSDWTHESCFSDGDHPCPTSLQRSPALTPTRSGPVWPWEESDNPFDLSGPEKPGVVGLWEQTSEWLSNLTPPCWCYHLDRCFQEGLGHSVRGIIYRTEATGV